MKVCVFRPDNNLASNVTLNVESHCRHSESAFICVGTKKAQLKHWLKSFRSFIIVLGRGADKIWREGGVWRWEGRGGGVESKTTWGADVPQFHLNWASSPKLKYKTMTMPSPAKISLQDQKLKPMKSKTRLQAQAQAQLKPTTSVEDRSGRDRWRSKNSPAKLYALLEVFFAFTVCPSVRLSASLLTNAET